MSNCAVEMTENENVSDSVECGGNGDGDEDKG